MWQRLLYVGRGGLAAFAIAAVDIALWDLYGLRAQQPLYALCGGQARAIPAYGSGVDLPKPLDALLAQAEGFMARGLPGVKVKVGRHDPREDEQRVAAVRNLIGDQVDLMLDANMTWSADEALERGRRLEQFGLYWYEEPTIPEDVAGHARLARELTVPIAIGESLLSAAWLARDVHIDVQRGLSGYTCPDAMHGRAGRAHMVHLRQYGAWRGDGERAGA